MADARAADGRRLPSDRRSGRVVLEAQTRQGWARVRTSFLPVLQAAVAVSIAYSIAHYVVGHPYPFFAPVCAWVVLGFTMDRSLRRVGELAIGVAVGVGLGDLLSHLIGSGWWQIALVLVASALVARFLDRGAMLTTQAGVQSMVLVGLPAAAVSGGAFGRWLDAAIGGAVAFLVAVLTPHDPRRHPRALARRATEELAGVLHVLARGLRTSDAQEVDDALARARLTQPVLDEWSDAASSARELARVAPASFRHRDELGRLGATSVLVDRAVRNARVLARRCRAAVEVDPPHDTGELGARLDDLARACDELAAALGSGRSTDRAAAVAQEVARALDPYVLAPDDWQAQSLVLLARSLTVDVQEAAGVRQRDARAALPEL
ncbi:FUSC family protein [Cellulomonas alba]|uniref:FUSC family protein n=1 Tax=Cellulomonas alba TaxID=3053467 RepID=A0ABT7SET0_9CELL|nr:FUSC family protein [Cellulomonas alba]MDM7854698.1 FUSC family protein [Cellulomonas alba]